MASTATLAKLRVLLSIDAGALRKGLSAEIGRIRTELNDVPAMAKRVGAAAAAAFGVAAAAGAALTKSVIGVASETEQARITMDALFGSVAEGKRAFDVLQGAARKLPFTFQDILASGRTLSVTVDNADELRKRIMQISEVSARFQIPLQQAAEQFNRLASAGAASADLFRERGVNAALGIKAGMTVSAKDSLKLWDRMFARIESEGSSAVGRLAHSWTGIVSMLQDQWRSIRQAIADAGLFEVVKAQAERIRAQIQGILDTGQVKSWAEAVSGLLSGAAEKAGDLVVAMIQNRNEIILWANVAVQSVQFVIRLIYSLARIAFEVGQVIGHSLRGAFSLVAAGWAKLDNLITAGLNKILEGLDKIPGINIDFRLGEAPAEQFMEDFRQQTRNVAQDMVDLKNAVAGVAGSYMDIVHAATAAAAAQNQAAAAGQAAAGGSGGAGGGGGGGAGGGFNALGPGMISKLLTMNQGDFKAMLSAQGGFLPSGQIVDSFIADFTERWGKVPLDLSHVVRNSGKQLGETLSGSLKQGGRYAVQSLIDGMMRGTQDMLSIVKSIAMQIANMFLTKGLNKAFGIASPSKAMRDVGHHLVEGLAIGVRQRLGMARDAAAELTRAASPGPIGMQLAGAGSAGGAPALAPVMARGLQIDPSRLPRPLTPHEAARDRMWLELLSESDRVREQTGGRR